MMRSIRKIIVGAVGKVEWVKFEKNEKFVHRSSQPFSFYKVHKAFYNRNKYRRTELNRNRKAPKQEVFLTIQLERPAKTWHRSEKQRRTRLELVPDKTSVD